MKPFTIDGIEYTEKFVAALREEAIKLRSAALETGSMGWAVSISHIIAALGALRDELEKGEKE